MLRIGITNGGEYRALKSHCRAVNLPMNDFSQDGAWPVDDICSFLQGSWTLSRRISDVRQNMPGIMQGKAIIATDGDGYVYREEGKLSFGKYRETVYRKYLYTFPAAHIAEVCFEDGRPFYRLDLSTGTSTVEHLCENDTYRGSFWADGPDGWRSSWTINGPNKELVLESRYQRVT
jgi:hypothetical protein